MTILSLFFIACSPTPKIADSALAKPQVAAPKPAPAAPVAAASDQLLGEIAGEAISLGDLDAKERGDLARQSAKSAVERWKVLRQVSKANAARRALSIAAKKAGKTIAELHEKLKKEVPQTPITKEILRAVYEGNREHFQGRKFAEVKDMIAEQLQMEIAHDQDKEIRNLLLERYKFKLRVAVPILQRIEVDRAKAPSRGPANAAVTVVLFSDFECPYCARQAKINDVLGRRFGDRVRWVYRHYPLDFHKHASLLAAASLCAHDQGVFWAFHDRLFDKRDGYDKQGVLGHGKAAGVKDLTAFEACISSGKHVKTVQVDIKAGDAAHLEGTPTLFVNGIPLYSLMDEHDLAAVIEAELQHVSSAAKKTP